MLLLKCRPLLYYTKNSRMYYSNALELMEVILILALIFLATPFIPFFDFLTAVFATFLDLPITLDFCFGVAFSFFDFFFGDGILFFCLFNTFLAFLAALSCLTRSSFLFL